MLRLDDALGEAALSPAPPRRLLPYPAPPPPPPPSSPAAPRPARPSGSLPSLPPLGLDTLPGIDDELGLPSAAPPPPRRRAPRSTLPLDAALPRPVTNPRTPAASTPRSGAADGPLGYGAEGDLAQAPLPSLLARLHREAQSGRLTLRRGDAEKSLFFDGGLVVHASSSLPHDRLGELLAREGRISREQNSRSRQLVERGGRRPVEALLEVGAVRPDETEAVMRHLCEEIIYSCFAWDRGTWTLGREVCRPEERLALPHPFALVMEGVRRKYTLERLARALGAPQAVITASRTLPLVTAGAALLPAEQGALQLLAAGPRTLSELTAVAGLTPLSLQALVFGLVSLGGLAAGPAQASLPSPPPDLAADAGRAVAVDPEAVVAVDRDRALAKHAVVRDGDYFAVLGLTRAASGYEVRRAHQRARADFAPERFAPSVRAELAGALAEIAEALDEALRALADDRLREAYRSHLPP